MDALNPSALQFHEFPMIYLQDLHGHYEVETYQNAESRIRAFEDEYLWLYSQGKILHDPQSRYAEVKNLHAKHVALCWPLEEAEFLALVFCEPLILFLIFHVAPYLLLIQPDCTDTIAAAPEMISPIRFAL